MRHELKKVYEDLRNLAMEKCLPIWTASQSNRESANSDIVGLENMSESYGKAQVADVVISISRKPSEKAEGFGRLYVAKNRAGRDGIVFPIKLNSAMSTFSILENASEMTITQAKKKNEDELKSLLQKKWKQVSKIEVENKEAKTEGDA
jgi:replicative DNA helicase